RKGTADFADYLMGEHARVAGADEVMTFDRALKARKDSASRPSPGHPYREFVGSSIVVLGDERDTPAEDGLSLRAREALAERGGPLRFAPAANCNSSANAIGVKRPFGISSPPAFKPDHALV